MTKMHYSNKLYIKIRHRYTKIWFIILCTIQLAVISQAAEVQKDSTIIPESVHHDTVFGDNIASVRLFRTGNELANPFVQLNGGQGLTLFFDDLDADIKEYVYTIELCNADWSSSQLSPQEYLEGFSENRINIYQTSVNTFVPFVHFELSLPNENIKWNKSGNYLLRVYEDITQRKLILVRRFVVFENQLKITQKYTFSEASKYNTNQEIDFVVNAKNFKISDPMQEIKLTVLQNGRWDNAIRNLPPLFTNGDDLTFDYQDIITFPASKEFRYIDLRSTRFPTERVTAIQRGDESWEMLLMKDLDRSNLPFLTYSDANGKYVVDNSHEVVDKERRSDYVKAKFSLGIPPMDSANVYLFGGFTDWSIKEEFKMEYDEMLHAYKSDIFLKQGYYNYLYAIVPDMPKNSIKKVDANRLEGDWYETNNEYSALIYYHPFGARWDRVIGIQTFDLSNR